MSTRHDNPPTLKTRTVESPALRNLRRRILPLASTAAALGLGGCGMLGLGHHSPAAAEQDNSNTVTISADSTAAQVKAFTAGMDEALSRVDKAKLAGAPGGDAAAPPNANTVAAPDAPTAPIAPAQAVATVPAAVPANQVVFSQMNSAGLPLQLGGDVPVLNLASWPARESAAGLMTMPLDLSRPGIIGQESAMGLPAAPSIIAAAPAVRPALIPAPAAASPAVTLAPDAQPSLDAALDVIRRHAAAHPSLNTALALALLEKDDGHAPDEASDKTLPANDQKVLQDLLGALDRMNQETSPATLAERTAPLLQAAKQWQGDADLSLPKLVLASRVDSYGVYSTVDPKFQAGKKETVIVYCEVANFSPKKTADGWYETHLSQQETLATDDGLLLWRPNAEEVEDRSRNLRRDFYLVKKLTIPDNLAVGKYALRMSVTDRNTNKIAVVTLPIEIVK